MNSYDSTYRYAYNLYENAKEFDDDHAKESYLKKAYGAAYLAATAGVDGASELLQKIEDYAKILNITL